MKLSKSLLQSMMVGLALGATANSCNTFFDAATPLGNHDQTCDKNCDKVHTVNGGEGPEVWDCPACGMG